MWKSEKKTNQHHQWQSDGGGSIISSPGAFAGHLPRHSFISFRFIFYVAHDYVPAHSPSTMPRFLLLLFIIEQSYYIFAPSRFVSSRDPHSPLHHYSAPVYVPMPLFTYATSKTKPDALRHVLIIRLQPSSGNADSVGSLFSSISTKSTKNERCSLFTLLPPPFPLTKQCKGQCCDLPTCLSSSVLNCLGSNCLVMRIRQAIHWSPPWLTEGVS